jgi:hypothetical protein
MAMEPRVTLARKKVQAVKEAQEAQEEKEDAKAGIATVDHGVDTDSSSDDSGGEEEKVIKDIANEPKNFAVEVDSCDDKVNDEVEVIKEVEREVEEKLLTVIESILSCTPTVNKWNEDQKRKDDIVKGRRASTGNISKMGLHTKDSLAEAALEPAPALRNDITDMCVLLGNPRTSTTMGLLKSFALSNKSLKNIAET